MKMEDYKLKLKNIIHDTQYCGICVENDNTSMNAIDEDFEIIVNQQTRTKSLETIIKTVFKETDSMLPSSLLCNNCTEKLIQAYIFIENAKETFKLIKKYIDDLFDKSNDILNHISDFQNESTNIVIVLENNKNSNKGNENNYTINKDELKIKEDITPETIGSKFKCANCFLVLPSFKSLKLHKEECGKETYCCKLCSKTFQNKKLLDAHSKMHSKVRCKFCHEILQVNQLMDHLKTYHRESLHNCLKCNEVFYTINTLQSHLENCKFNKDNQCLMCLETFEEGKLSSHTCKFGCPECSEVPCMHYKYLVSYREQVLKDTGKVKCLDCDYVCRKKSFLLGHVNRKHLKHNPFTCDQCGQQFHSKMVLMSHIQRLHEEYFVCQYCNSEFSNQVLYDM